MVTTVRGASSRLRTPQYTFQLLKRAFLSPSSNLKNPRKELEWPGLLASSAHPYSQECVRRGQLQSVPWSQNRERGLGEGAGQSQLVETSIRAATSSIGYHLLHMLLYNLLFSLNTVVGMYKSEVPENLFKSRYSRPTCMKPYLEGIIS